MVQKSQTTTWDVQKLVNNGINYQPQLVQDFFHQQYHLMPSTCWMWLHIHPFGHKSVAPKSSRGSCSNLGLTAAESGTNFRPMETLKRCSNPPGGMVILAKKSEISDWWWFWDGNFETLQAVRVNSCQQPWTTRWSVQARSGLKAFEQARVFCSITLRQLDFLKVIFVYGWYTMVHHHEKTPI